MALVKVGEKALLAVRETGELERVRSKAPAKKVLDEETYSEVRKQ